MWFPRPALIRILSAGYGRSDFFTDVGSGLLVGIVALPLAMAFAIASGCKPEQGLFTAIIAGVLVGLLGGCRTQIAGPTGAFVGLCAAGVAHYGYGGLALATLMAGALLIGMGMLRLGRAIEFIPMPIVIGFTAGIAVVIASTQLKDAFGLEFSGNPGEFYRRIAVFGAHLRESNPAAIAICASTVVLTLLLRKLSPKLPAALIAIVIVGVGAALLRIHVTAVASRYGEIPHTLPHPAFPQLGLGSDWSVADLAHRLYELRWLAISIALLGAIESLLSAVVADGMSGDRHDSDTELVGQGITNLISPLFLGLPVTGAIARTATNIRAGARSPVSSIVHGLALLGIVLIAAPLASQIPLACLAGVLLVVCWNMAEVRHWPQLFRAKISDAVLFVGAFLLTVFVDLTVAVIGGTLLAMLFFVRRMAEVTQIEPMPEDDRTLIDLKKPVGVEIYEVRGPFFFGVASMIRGLINRISGKPRVLILHIRSVPFVDASAAFALRDLLADCAKHRIAFMLAGVQARPLGIIERFGLVEKIGKERIFTDLQSALSFARSLVSSPASAVDPSRG